MSRRDPFQIFVCFIFNVSLGSAPKRKNFDIQRNTGVDSGGRFTSNRLSNDRRDQLWPQPCSNPEKVKLRRPKIQAFTRDFQ